MLKLRLNVYLYDIKLACELPVYLVVALFVALVCLC